MSSRECVAQDAEGLLRFFTSYLEYNQIWLNGLEDDPLLFYTTSYAQSPLWPRKVHDSKKTLIPRGALYVIHGSRIRCSKYRYIYFLATKKTKHIGGLLSQTAQTL